MSRTTTIRARVSDEEKVQIAAMADRHGLTESAFLRAAALQKLPSEGGSDVGPLPSFGDSGGVSGVGLRTEILPVRLAPEERVYLEEQAELCGLALGTYIRSVALGVTPRARHKAAELALVRQLARCGNNLNQLVRLSHEGRLPGGRTLLQAVEDVGERITEVLELLSEDIAS